MLGFETAVLFTHVLVGQPVASLRLKFRLTCFQFITYVLDGAAKKRRDEMFTSKGGGSKRRCLETWGSSLDAAEELRVGYGDDIFNKPRSSPSEAR